MRIRTHTALLACVAVHFAVGATRAQTPMTTAISFQGQLKSGGVAATGAHDLDFSLWRHETSTNVIDRIGVVICRDGITPVDGLFTVDLNFGATPWNGDALWLEIRVRADATASNCSTPTPAYTTLTPRLPVTAAPYALYSRTAAPGHRLNASDGSPTDAVFVDAAGNTGIGTTTPPSQLSISESSDPTVTTFTQGLTNAGINIVTGYTPDNYTPGLFWSTSDNNATRPKAGIYLRETTSGTQMHLGTSNSYGTGITNNALSIMPSGFVGIGTASPVARLHLADDSLWIGGTDSGVLGTSAGTGLRLLNTSTESQIFAYDYAAGLPRPLSLQAAGGNVGIGTAAGTSTLTVQGSGTLGDLWIRPSSNGNADLILTENSTFGMVMRHNATSNLTEFIGIQSGVENTRPAMTIARGSAGAVTVNFELRAVSNDELTETIELTADQGTGGGRLTVRGPNNLNSFRVDGNGADGGSVLTMQNPTGSNIVVVDATDGAVGGGLIQLRNTGGTNRIILDADNGDGGALLALVGPATNTSTVNIDAFDAADGGARVTLRDSAASNRIVLDAMHAAGEGGRIAVINSSGSTVIDIDAEYGGVGSPGRIRAPLVESTSGGFMFPDGTTQSTAAMGGPGFWSSSAGHIYNNNAGFVGVGTNAPAALFHVEDGSAGLPPNANSIAAFESDSTAYLSLITPSSSERGILFGDQTSDSDGSIIYNNTSTLDGFQFRTGGNNTRMVLTSAGLLGLGVVTPNDKLHVHNGDARFTDANASNSRVEIQTDVTNANAQRRAQIALYNRAGNVTAELDSQEWDQDGGLRLYDNGVLKINLDPRVEFSPGSFASAVITDVLVVNGADLSEKFDVTAAAGEPQPGMVVVLDEHNPGKLRVATEAYDHKVAGVMSGAGGVRPGLMMEQKDTLASGAHPVALTGRVYVFVDADIAPVKIGDMLTTSATPGHAMKVQDHAAARGAILGKAMMNLESGKGLVLMLVSLQ